MLRLLCALLSIAVAASCELFVDGELPSIHCLDEGRNGPPACPAGASCVDGVCTPGTIADVGKACEVDADCRGGTFCVDPASVGAGGDRICTRPCCSSAECGDPELGFVCWMAGVVAGGTCQRAVDAGRDVALGAGSAGDACATAEGCRSGVCLDGRCVDACCGADECKGGACVLSGALVAETMSWTCGAEAPGAAAYLAPCVVDADCASRFCVTFPDGMRCSIPCCASADCASLPTGELVRCADVGHEASLVHACAGTLPATAIGGVGAPCTSELECRSGLCLKTGDVGMCTDVCCADDDCGVGYACRPYELDTTWALRCVPK